MLQGNAQPVDESGPRGPAAGLNNDNVVIVRDLSEYVEEVPDPPMHMHTDQPHHHTDLRVRSVGAFCPFIDESFVFRTL